MSLVITPRGRPRSVVRREVAGVLWRTVARGAVFGLGAAAALLGLVTMPAVRRPAAP